MADRLLDRQLRQLEPIRYTFGPGVTRRVAKLLARLGARRFPDVASLIGFHETLLFLRAFPHGPATIRQTQGLLRGFSQRVEQLRRAGADMDEFDPLEVSGIAGATMQDTLSYDLVLWMVKHLPGKLEIAWDDYHDERAMGAVWPLLMPLQAEDAYVEADVPWRKWLQTVRPEGKSQLRWLVEQIQQLPGSALEKSRVYDRLRLPVRWMVGNQRYSRTLNWKTPRETFYHRGPLITRSEVSLAEQLAQPPPVLRRLPRAAGEAAMNLIREIMLVRYRELYGTTLGDPNSVVRADVGRGVSIYLWNLPPGRRLPLRAYVAGFTLKNGVPINYIEAIGVCEWMEVGFNTFYTFRGGEVAWIFAQALRCLARLTGATCISMYPYQLGDGNDEAIESGAYWFYRKLGFRPARAEQARLVEREERRIARDRKHRTSARTLRRLAAAHLIYELPGGKPGAWDKFSPRTIGLEVNRRMAREFQGDSTKLRRTASAALAKILGEGLSEWTVPEKEAFENFAVLLRRVPVLSWRAIEKRDLVQLIRAKAGPDEMRYLRLTQKHVRLREALLQLGS